MGKSSSEWERVIPLIPIARHFIVNAWYLRFVLVILMSFLAAASAALFWLEGDAIAPGSPISYRLKELCFITSSALLPVTVSSFKPSTDLGKVLTLVEGLCGYLLLGLLLWLVQASMEGHPLKIAKYGIFPSSRDSR